MKIGDRIFVRGYIDEIRKDTVIVRNDGGYFGTVLSEVTGELPSAQPDERMLHESCTDCPLYDKDRHSCPRFNKVIPVTLRELQSAQPERKKGQWIDHEIDKDFAKCSECGSCWEWGFVKNCNMNFCPNCGAKMEE